MAAMGGKQGRAKRVRRQFTDEFKVGAVRLVPDEGKTIADGGQVAATQAP